MQHGIITGFDQNKKLKYQVNQEITNNSNWNKCLIRAPLLFTIVELKPKIDTTNACAIRINQQQRASVPPNPTNFINNKVKQVL